jgi:acylphosphatase
VEWARLSAVVHGRVQGVNFRAYTRRRALNLDLRGYVRNSWDGTVEAVVEGPRKALDQFLAFLRVGPPSAWVERVDTTWEAATGEFWTFEVRY